MTLIEKMLSDKTGNVLARRTRGGWSAAIIRYATLEEVEGASRTSRMSRSQVGKSIPGALIGKVGYIA